MRVQMTILKDKQAKRWDGKGGKGLGKFRYFRAHEEATARNDIDNHLCDKA